MPNQWFILPIPSWSEGRRPSSRTLGGERWTLMLRRRNATEAYGKTVWSWRPWQASSRRTAKSWPAVTESPRTRLRGEHDISRKAIAQGMSDVLRCPVCSCALCFSANRTRDRGCSAHPAFPAPSDWRGREVSGKARAQCVARLRNHIQSSSRRRPGPIPRDPSVKAR